MAKIQEPPLMEERLYKVTEQLKPETLAVTIKKGDRYFNSLLASTELSFKDVDEKCIFSVEANYVVEKFCEQNMRGWVVDFVPQFSCQFTTCGMGTRCIDTSPQVVEGILRTATGAYKRISFIIDPIEFVMFADLDKDQKYVNELIYWRFAEKP